MVSIMLTSKSAPQPAIMATPAGGTAKFAAVSASGSEPGFQGFRASLAEKADEADRDSGDAVHLACLRVRG